jgi:hypothetical protein
MGASRAESRGRKAKSQDVWLSAVHFEHSALPGSRQIVKELSGISRQQSEISNGIKLAVNGRWLRVYG